MTDKTENLRAEIEVLKSDVMRLAKHCSVLEDAVALGTYWEASASFAQLPRRLQDAIESYDEDGK